MGPVDPWSVPPCPSGVTNAGSRRCKSALGARFADAVGHCNVTDPWRQSATGSESGSRVQVLAEAGGGLGWRSGVRRAPPPPTHGQAALAGRVAHARRAWLLLMGGGSSYSTLGEACCSAQSQESGPRALDRITLPTLMLASPAPCALRGQKDRSPRVS